MSKRAWDLTTPTRGQRLVSGILKTLDLTVAILLLTGQVSLTGVFVYPKGLYLSVTGPIFNGQRLVGESYFANGTLNAMDILVALLLILDQLHVYGPFPGPHVLSLTVTGPPLGVTSVPVPYAAPNPKSQAIYKGFREQIVEQFRFRGDEL